MCFTPAIDNVLMQTRTPGLRDVVTGIRVPAIAGNPQGKPRQQDATSNRE
ncbi:MAG: hypothetical protein ACRETO_04025 [Gammaproteobacteria bacterium]